jgi:hypothetical protein
MQSLAPVVVFGFQRVETLEKTVSALRSCLEAKETELFVYLDAEKNKSQEEAVAAVLSYAKIIDGFKSIQINKAVKHQGLAYSVITGVTETLKKYKSVIVVEDDLMVSSNFLSFMNQALDFYENSSKIFSISGFSFPMQRPAEYVYDNYFTKRASSWGWATWTNRWEEIDWNVKDFDTFSNNKKAQHQFDEMGSDLTNMLMRYKAGKVDSWAIRWVYHQFKHSMYSVYPIDSKVRNIGFGERATHTSQLYNRFDTVLDSSQKSTFNFNPDPGLDRYFIQKFISRYGLLQRAVYKVLNFFQ